MVSKADFQDMVQHAYQTLYDFVELRSHPLTQRLITDNTVNPKERGWQMHHMLLDVVEELYPGPDAPPFSKEWRRHRLMVLRYVEAMEPQAVADQLSISRRQFYREHAAALDAIANILWERYAVKPMLDEPIESLKKDVIHNASDVMQMELVRINQVDSFADLNEVLEGVLTILETVFQQQAIEIAANLPNDLPIVSIGHNLLRQTLLSILGFIVEHIRESTVQLTGLANSSSVYLQIVPHPLYCFDEDAITQQFADFQTMLQLGNSRIVTMRDEQQQPIGLELELPLEYDCTVLAVDDNEDTLALFKRCLTPNRYRVITTNTARSAVSLAQKTHPDVIILDLMMPEQDGWDLLQALANQPDTAHIPIMICSVLKQRQLALSLGAAAFLEKPFTEHTLLEALHNLRVRYFDEEL